MKRITILSTLLALAGICFFIIVLSGDDCDNCFSDSAMAAKFFACGLVISIGSLYFKSQFVKTEKIIFDVESYPILDVHDATGDVPFAGYGTIEIKDGKVLKSPYANADCVYYHSIKEKFVQSGKHSHWDIVENITGFVPFYIKDETGKLQVDPSCVDDDFSNFKIVSGEKLFDVSNNSEIDCQPLLKKNDYSDYSKGRKFLGIAVGEKYRRSEFVLPPGVKVFSYGIVSKRENQLVLHEDKNNPLIISRKDRDQYVQEFYKGGNITYLAHILMAFGYTIAIFSINHFLNANSRQLVALLAIGNTLIVASFLFAIYNRLITLKNRALNSLSNIEIELKRRADLIPNLVQIVKAYSRYESNVQEKIARLRSAPIFLKNLPAPSASVAGSIIVLAEKYPDLKASQNFILLMDELTDTEDRIACSREFYNRSVRKYDTLVGQFPFSAVAWLGSLKPMEFISI